MSLTNKIAALAASLIVTVLAGCGGSDGTGNQPVAAPTGAFSTSNLSGTYVFSYSGYDRTHGYVSFFAVVGTLTANGAGVITGGSVDIDDPALGAALDTNYVWTRLPVAGNYSVGADGRGSGSITVTINGAPVDLGLEFVLSSSAHGMVSRFDGNGTGSGTIDLQASNVAQGALQGSYAFGLGGVDATLVNSLTTVGSFTLDADGNITAGLQDFNDNGDSSRLRALALQGSVIAGSSPSAQLTTVAEGFATLHFDVWVIDASHLKLIETDSIAYLEGDAYVSTGQTAFPAGPLVFTLTGEDAGQGGFAAAGLLTSDGSSLITGGVEDFNDSGYVTQAPSISGSFSSSGVRALLTVKGIYNGGFVNNTATTGNYTFAAYPCSGGVLLMEIDNGAGSALGLSAGNIYRQSATSLAASRGYGLNLTGGNLSGEVDMIAEIATTEDSMTGLYDVNNFGWLISGASLGDGTFSGSSNGRGTAQFPNLGTNGNSFISELNLAYYVIDDSTAVFVETDYNQTATGTLELQTPSGASAAALSHFMPIQTTPKY